MHQRSVKAIVRPRPSHHGQLLSTLDVSEEIVGEAMGSFLFVSLFSMRGPVFPPHPHAGFSVATYMLPESPTGFINQDSLGTRNTIAPGSLHVTLAGSGIVHEEQPEVSGAPARGFQIWIDHADAHREDPPAALHLTAAEVPRVEQDGNCLRVLLGGIRGVHSPLLHPTPAVVVDLDLRAGAPLEFSLTDEQHAFVVGLEGSFRVDDTVINADEVAVILKGREQLQFAAVTPFARATLFGGATVSNYRVRSGPFVASDSAQMQSFVARYRSGDFGQVRPFMKSA